MILERKLDISQLKEAIEKLIVWDALEFTVNEQQKKLWIPYLMNDAVEQYLLLEGCVVRGTLDAEAILDTDVELIEETETKGLILRQPSGNMVTVWYKEATETIGCYQYHQIGHAWRKEPGEEFVRRLVNLLCVLHDKRNYLGAAYCSEEECLLADLAEFPPILYFTPINEPIVDWYPETQQGIDAIMKIAKQAGDTKLQEELLSYANSSAKGKRKEKQVRVLAQKLIAKEHADLWYLIQTLIFQASERLPKRSYGQNIDQQIEQMRKETTQKYLRKGFSGTYPKLTMQNSKGQTEELWFVEEQPFTVLEWEDYRFRIFSVNMVHKELQHSLWTEELCLK